MYGVVLRLRCGDFGTLVGGCEILGIWWVGEVKVNENLRWACCEDLFVGLFELKHAS